MGGGGFLVYSNIIMIMKSKPEYCYYFQAEYSVYVTVVVLCGAFGTSIVFPLLSLKLRVNDCILGWHHTKSHHHHRHKVHQCHSDTHQKLSLLDLTKGHHHKQIDITPIIIINAL